MKNRSRVLLLSLFAMSLISVAFLPSPALANRDCYCKSYIRECYCTNRLAEANALATGACCADKLAKKAAADMNPLADLGVTGKPGEYVSQDDLHKTSKAAEPASAATKDSASLQQRPPQQDNRYEESTFYTYQVDRYQFSVRTQSGAVTMQGVNLINNRAELSFHVPTNGDRRADEYHDFVLIRAGDRIPASVRDSWSVGLFTYQNQTWRLVEYVQRDDRQRR